VAFEWREHTAEVELVIDASTEADVFAEALRAFAELVEVEREGERATHVVELEEPDRARLLAAWLEELIYLADTDSFVPERAEIELRDDGLRARVEGRRAQVDPIAKAATYHRLTFEPGWHATVVLDV
jgi:SHS2 domain-containing protein